MKRIVVKIGTGVLAENSGRLEEDVIRALVKEMCVLLWQGKEILVVSSGAIGAGMWLLNVKRRPSQLAELQSIAAIGQTKLMDTYNKYFNKDRFYTGQILLTQDDFDDRKRYLNIKYTINTLMKHGAVPIINENDTISTEEIRCGDNDRISALVADLAEADALILLTNVDGLMDREGRLIKNVDKVNDSIRNMADRTCAVLGTGGMRTKIQAAEHAVKSGIDCYIANGKKENILRDVVSGKAYCTYFKKSVSRVAARKRWISFGSKPKGHIIIDDGARTALVDKKKSLLSAGIVDVKGHFSAGDIVTVSSKSGKDLARGVANYSSGEIKKIKKAKTKDIENILGHKGRDEVVHRDHLVILD